MRRHDPLRDLDDLIARVHAFVAYRLGEGPDADDVTSETFERAVRYRRTYDPSKGEPIAWLVGIARRCIDEARRAPSERSLGSVHAAGSRFEEAAIGRVDLWRALARLATRDRELLALRYGSDLSAAQIAEVLDMRTNAVEVALHRALTRLRRELAHEDEPEAAAGTSVAP